MYSSSSSSASIGVNVNVNVNVNLECGYDAKRMIATRALKSEVTSLEPWDARER